MIIHGTLNEYMNTKKNIHAGNVMQNFMKNMSAQDTLSACMKIKRIMNATSVKKDFTQNMSTKGILERMHTKQIMNPHDIPSQRVETNANINVRKAMHHFIQKIVWQSILNKHIMKKRRDESTRHIEPTHGSKRKYKCKKCNASFYSKDRLAKHIKQTHNEEEK
eukprot:1008220_1